MSVMTSTESNFSALYYDFKVDMAGNAYANNMTLTGKIISSEMTNSVIKGGSLEIGSGSSVFKADTQGIYLGSQMFGSAPFRVSATGNLVATNATLTNANISGNINMTGGSINWASIGKPSYSAAEVGALASSSPMLTNITPTGIYTGAISANQITAGRITASQIDTTNLSVARLYQNGSPNNYVVLGGNYGDLELYYGGNKYFTIYNDVGSVTLKHYNKEHLRFSSVTNNAHPLGTWDFSGANVQGLNVIARFG